MADIAWLAKRIGYHFVSSGLVALLVFWLISGMGLLSLREITDYTDLIFTWQFSLVWLSAVWAHILFDIPEHGWTLPHPFN